MERVRPTVIGSLVTALLVVVAGLVPGLVPTASAADSGELAWGVKQSFVSYVTGPIAHGTVTTGGAAQTRGSQFVFALTSGGVDAATGAGAAEYEGSVNFAGHDGALDLTLADPRVTLDSAESGTLSVRATEGSTDLGRVELAELDLSAATVSTVDGARQWAGVAVTLTSAGVPVLGGNYPAGTALDSLDLVIPVNEDSTPTEPTPTPTEPTATSPTTEPTTEPTALTPGTALEGRLIWGVKESFRNYIGGVIAQGSITVEEPATRESGLFVFAQTSTAASTSTGIGQTSFGGGVRFTGHHGQLDLTISEPRVTLTSATTGELSALVENTGTDLGRIVIGALDIGSATKSVATGSVTFANVPVTLTAAGEQVFALDGAPFYSAGTALDPATIVVGANAGEGTTGPVPAPTAPTPTSTPTTSTPTTSTKGDSSDTTARAGSLTWGVKSSFRSYVTGPIAQGSVSVSSGATSTGGVYRFGQTSTTADPPSATGTTRYGGVVRFTGHHGLLNLSMADPVVTVTSKSSGRLSVVLNGGSRITIGTLDLSAGRRSSSDGAVAYSAVPVTLTSAGSSIFSYGGSSFYPAGSAMDPVSFVIGSKAASSSAGSRVVSAAASTTTWTPPATPPATTGIEIAADQLDGLAAGDEITATATGFRANEPDIKVVLYSTPVILADDLVADATGRVTWTGRIPASTEAGDHTLTFQGTVDRGIAITVAESNLEGCTVDGATIDWGFKESFRSYVSGSIANGDWSTTGGATYTTPQFSWSGGTGSYQADTGTGRIDFTGTVQFTGHDGALDTTIANPTIEFTGEDTAQLLLDIGGVSMNDAMDGDATRVERAAVPFADLDLSADTVTRTDDSIVGTEVSATLTASGHEAFENYEAGTVLDPVSFTIPFGSACGTVTDTAVDTEARDGADPVPSSADGSISPWVTLAVGVVLGGLIFGAFSLIRRRASVSS